MDFSQFDLTDPFVRRALAETLAEDNGLDYQDEYIRKALNDEIAAAAAPKPIDGERNFFGDTVSRLARGGVQLADTAIHAVDTAVGGSETLQGWSDSLGKAKQNVGLLRPDKSEHEEGWLKRSYGQALESAPMSAVPWAGAMAGASMGAVAGPAGAVAGGLIGGTLAMGGLFGLGTYGQRKEEVERELTATRPDLTLDEISKMAHDNAKNHAFAETGGESAGDLASWAILSKVPGGQAIFKGGKAILAELVKPNAFKAIALGIGKAMPFEVGSEVGTAIWQNEADKAIGVEQGTSTDAALAAIGPALFLSAGMGVAVGGYSANQRRVQYNALNSEDQQARAQAVDQVAGTLAEATDQQTAKKWRDMALGFVQNGQPIPLDMNLAELSANEPEVAAPEAQDQPAETILKAESVDEAIKEAEAEIAKPGWLAPTAPDLEESEWLQQGVAAKAYNQGRNELGATPVSRAGLLGQAMEPLQVAAPADPLTELLSTISTADQPTLLQMADGLPGLVEGSPELAPYQRQLSEAISKRQRILWEESNVGRGKVSGDQGGVAARGEQVASSDGTGQLSEVSARGYRTGDANPVHGAGVEGLDNRDQGATGGRVAPEGVGEKRAGVEQASPLLTAARQHVAETGDMTMGGLMKALDVDIDTAEKLLEQVKATTPLPRNIGGTQAATVGADTGGFLTDQAIRKTGATSPATTAGDAQGFIADQGIRKAAGTATAAPVADTEGFVRDQQIRRDAMGRGPKPTRAADEPARAFLARKREWEKGNTSSQHNGEHPTQAPNINPLEKPWMLTKEEYHRAIQSRFGMGAEARQSVGSAFSAGRGGELAEGVPYRQVNYEQHARKVARAIRSGEAVPAGVLAEYPGYLEKYRRSPATRKREGENSVSQTGGNETQAKLPRTDETQAGAGGAGSEPFTVIDHGDGRASIKVGRKYINNFGGKFSLGGKNTAYTFNTSVIQPKAVYRAAMDAMEIQKQAHTTPKTTSTAHPPSVEGVTAPSPGEAGTGFDPLALLTGKGGKPSAEEPARNQHLKRVQELLADTEREINDWATRRYKDNKKTVTVGGDVDSLNASDMEIGRINESRRKRTIEALVRRRKDLEAARDSLESDPESVEDIAADLKAEYGIDLAAQPSTSKATAKGNGEGGPQKYTVANRWDSSKDGYRVELVKRGQWTTKKDGGISRLGEKIALSKWDDLSPAAKRILTPLIQADYGSRVVDAPPAAQPSASKATPEKPAGVATSGQRQEQAADAKPRKDADMADVAETDFGNMESEQERKEREFNERIEAKRKEREEQESEEKRMGRRGKEMERHFNLRFDEDAGQTDKQMEAAIDAWIAGSGDAPSRIFGDSKGNPLTGKTILNSSPSKSFIALVKRMANEAKRPFAVVRRDDRNGVPVAGFIVELPTWYNERRTSGDPIILEQYFFDRATNTVLETVLPDEANRTGFVLPQDRAAQPARAEAASGERGEAFARENVKKGHYIKRKQPGLGDRKVPWELVSVVSAEGVMVDNKTFVVPFDQITDIRTGMPDLGRGEVIFKDGVPVGGKVSAQTTSEKDEETTSSEATKSNVSPSSPKTPIADFGEKIGGARKEDGIVEHTTKRGKVLRGRIVTGISYRQAKEADPYTFKKDGGFFIREGAGEVKKDDAPAGAKETAPEKGEAQPKENLAIKRLRISAERLKAAGEAKLNQNRNVNTARRARMANNAEADARADIRTAETLLNIVNAQEDGTAGALAGLTSKAQLETLQGILTQAKYAEERKKENGKQDHARLANKDDIKSAVYLYPHFYDYKDLDALIDLLGNKKGWRTKRNDLRRGGLVVNGKERIEMLREALKLAGDDYRFRAVGEHLKGYGRLQKAGITDDLALREALERLVELSGKAPEKNRAQELERALVGQNNGIDFFPTPKAQAKFIVDRAGIEPGMRVLEPSAGTGNLAEEMRAQGGEVEVAEISPAHREVLEAKGFKIVEHDFMDMEEGGYDVIVMNPPFSNNMDIDHVRNAYELLKPGGRVVAIMGEGAFFRTGKKETEFREWLDEVGINEKLPEGFFKDKKELRTTGVNARVVEIDKPDVSEDGRPVESNYKSAREYLAALQQWREETGNANEYEQRREDRADRIEARADKLNSEAAAAFERSAKIGERFHGGQPILVGHHSEKSARAAQAKMHSAMDKSVDLGKQADEAAYRAEAARRNKAISSDDEDAIVKLKAKIEAAEEEQAQYKAINKALRVKDTVKGDAELAKQGYTSEQIVKLREPDFMGRVGIPDYRLTNNNANIRRMKQRLESLERNRQDETQEFEFDGGKIIDNVEDNRVQIDFDAKPSAELREALKGSAFAWAPSVSMWQRKRGGNALYAAKRIVGLTEDGPKLSTTALPPSARADIQGELTQAFGKLRARVLMRKITVLESQEEIKALAAKLSPDGMYSEDGTIIQAFAHNGHVYMAADGVEKGHVVRTLKHEFAHIARLGLRGTKPWQALLRSVDERMNEDSATGKALREARKKVPADTDADLIAEETLAYAVELSPEVGLVRRAIAMIKRFLVNMGVSPNIFTVEDWSALTAATLRGQARVAMGEGVRQSVREMFKPVDTESAAFKRWFGDSKVVDADGKPLVVYKGMFAYDPDSYATNFRGEVLKDDRTNDNVISEINRRTKFPSFFSGDDGVEIAGFFTNTPDVAARFAPKESGAIFPVYLAMKNPYIIDAKGEAAGKFQFERGGQSFRAAIRSGNHDGVVIKNTKDEGDVYVALRPEQIKSAISNTGQFSASDPRIRYSKRFEADEADERNPLSWDAPLDSKKDSFLYNTQNKFIDLFRVQDAIQKHGGTITEETDVRLAEELYHKRSAKRVDDFLINEVKPLMAELAEVAQDEKEFERFLWARHAAEANESLRLRNPNAEELREMKRVALERRNALAAKDEVKAFLAKEREMAAAKHDVETGEADDPLLMVLNQEMNEVKADPIVQEYERARARHEGLKKVKPFDGDNTWLSGMKDDEAKAFMRGLSREKKTAYSTLAAKWDNLIKKTRQTLVEYELEDQETVDSWAAAFDFYVPLNREDMDGGKGIGQGFSVKGASTKGRTGSYRAVSNILANIVLQRERAVVRGEKAAISSALHGLATANPNKDFWSIEIPPTERTVDPVTGMVINKADMGYKNKPNVVVNRFINERGKIEERAVVFNDQNKRAVRMAEALKNLDTQDLGAILGASAKITRFFSAMNTQYNVVFGPVNLVRDAQAAVLNLSTTPLKDKKAAVVRRIAGIIPSLYKAVRAENAGRPLQNEIAQAWREMQLEGGTTGFRDMFADSNERAERLRADILQIKQGKSKRAIFALRQWVSDYNDMLENSTRLAVYMEARESGISKKRAAQLAKDVTLNFNRKGQVATQAGAMYAFFNAAAQGTEKMYRTLTGPAGKKIITGGLMLGAAQTILLAAAGFDEDEPPEFIRERNLILPIGGKKYITVPMPLGFHVIPNLTRIPTEWALRGFKEPGKAVTEIAAIFAEAFNPLGNAGFSMQTFAPTPMDPFIALGENKDWTGRPIAKQDFNTLKPTPGHTRARDTASWPSEMVSRALNLLTGGNEYVPGMLSPTPDQIDYLVGQAAGGVGREAGKLLNVGRAAARGESSPAYRIPFVGRFYGNSGDISGVASRYYTSLKRVNRIALELDGIRENGGNVAKFIRSNPEARTIRYTEATYRNIQKLQRAKRRMLEGNASRSRVEAIDRRIIETMRRFNERTNPNI